MILVGFGVKINPLSEWNNIKFKTIKDDMDNRQEILTSLCLYNLDITVIPPEIGMLTGLEELLLYDNRLQNLPNEIGNLIHLKVLWLQNNKFTNIPSDIYKLINLYLHNNQLSNLPNSIIELSKLTDIDIDKNKIQLENVDGTIIEFLQGKT